MDGETEQLSHRRQIKVMIKYKSDKFKMIIFSAK